ncbi:kelch-like protein 5 [Teleopsis dalmanni]|uniref:kelch-like protein 5 n=1 Tax=Teleopsis dalmanni TaxID=139649 RepID=UPI0018CFA514|nr:kelch-like protein 5 [Teleopsis dalmanni]XP_037950901.1 kelch-like protein 5 [Teleopsis dalmanni]
MEEKNNCPWLQNSAFENSAAITPFTEQTPSCSNKNLPKSLHEMGFRNSIPNWNKLCKRFKQVTFDDMINWCKNTEGDIIIKIGESVFSCHRLILTSYSNYFKKRRTITKLEVSDENITPGAFHRLYKWMLDNKEKIDCDGVMELIKVAIYFEISVFLEFCWQMFSNEQFFSEDVAFMVYNDARNYDFPELKEVMLKRVRKFFIQLTCTEEFLLLNATELGLLISSNYIEVNMESEVFFSVVHWLDHDWEQRNIFLLPLMQCIRFNTMPAAFLLYLFRGTDCEEVQRVIENEEVFKMVQNGLEFSVAKESCPIKELPNMIAKLKLPYKPRFSIFDPGCNYHHRSDCARKAGLTYSIYLTYLEKLQNASPSYWQTFITADDPKAQCCDEEQEDDSEIDTACCSQLLHKNFPTILHDDTTATSSGSSITFSKKSPNTDQSNNDTDTTESWFQRMKFSAKHLRKRIS